MDLSTQSEQSQASRNSTPDAAIEALASGNFQRRVLEGEGPIAVEFMSYSCSHCGEIDPVLRQVAARLDGQERVFRVNVVREPALAARYQVEGTPTFVMFLQGAVVGRSEGPRPTPEAVLDALTRPFSA